MTGRITIVVATWNRRELLLATMDRLARLGHPLIVVDNGSSDGTAEAARASGVAERVVALTRNVGASARNIGAMWATTPYVAFADDDSWWADESLTLAGSLLDEHRQLGLVAARVLVGDRAVLDPLSAQMAQSPLGAASVLGGRRVLGFLACAAVVRRDGFLATGGFPARFMMGGEEEPVALDMRSAGWELAYVPQVAAHHHPQVRSEEAADRRRRLLARNALWTAWLRYPAGLAAAVTRESIRRGRRDRAVARGVADALRSGCWTARRRRPVPDGVARELELLRSSAKAAFRRS